MLPCIAPKNCSGSVLTFLFLIIKRPLILTQWYNYCVWTRQARWHLGWLPYTLCMIVHRGTPNNTVCEQVLSKISKHTITCLKANNKHCNAGSSSQYTHNYTKYLAYGSGISKAHFCWPPQWFTGVININMEEKVCNALVIWIVRAWVECNW